MSERPRRRNRNATGTEARRHTRTSTQRWREGAQIARENENNNSQRQRKTTPKQGESDYPNQLGDLRECGAFVWERGEKGERSALETWANGQQEQLQKHRRNKKERTQAPVIVLALERETGMAHARAETHGSETQGMYRSANRTHEYPPHTHTHTHKKKMDAFAATRHTATNHKGNTQAGEEGGERHTHARPRPTEQRRSSRGMVDRGKRRSRSRKSTRTHVHTNKGHAHWFLRLYVRVFE